MILTFPVFIINDKEHYWPPLCKHYIDRGERLLRAYSDGKVLFLIVEPSEAQTQVTWPRQN